VISLFTKLLIIVKPNRLLDETEKSLGNPFPLSVKVSFNKL